MEVEAEQWLFNKPLDAALLWISRYWLGAFTLFASLFALLPVAAPLLGAMGLQGACEAIFALYASVCHQLPSRSYEIAGHFMAYCQRNTAIYTTMALSAMAWNAVRDRVPRLKLLFFSLLALPMAVDGFTQLFELRESNWYLRTVTGALFGLACVWYAFPLLERYAALLRPELERLTRLRTLAEAGR
jgi:uncharacterized membrane protein